MTHHVFAPLCLGLLAGPLLAQNVRDTVQVDPGFPGASVSPSISTDGDLSAIVFNDVGSGHQINVSTSDGRGLSWSTPVRIDDDATGATKLAGTLIGTQNKNLVVDGDNIYAVWRDNRNAPSSTKTNVYFTRSTDGGATWDPNTLMDTGTTPSVDDVRDWTMVASDNYVYVLISVDPDDASDEELYLVSSADSGATFNTGVSVTTVNGTGVDIDDIGLAADGPTVYVVWADDRNGSVSNDDVFFNKSTDGGLTFGADVKVNSSALGTGDAESTTAVAVFGNVVFVAWEEELASTTNEELRGAISLDGGATFGADFQIGNYTAGAADTDLPWIAIVGGVPVATWEDNRSGSDEVHVAASSDGGATWVETQIGSSGQFPRLVSAEQAPLDPNVAVTYSTSGATGAATLAYSRDNGFTWSPALTVSQSAGDVDNSEAAWSPLYGNYLSAFLANDVSTNNVFAGGVRPQTLDAVNLISGSNANFDLSGWKADGTPRFCWVLGSNSAGTLPLPFGDGRNLGLAFDGTFLATLTDAATFLSTLDGAGAGATGSFPLAVPTGTVFYAAAVSFEVGPVTFVELSDVAELTVQ